MPFLSKAQQRFAYANPDKFGGQEGLKEWSADTDFDTLPEKKKPRNKKFAFAPKTRMRTGYSEDQRIA